MYSKNNTKLKNLLRKKTFFFCLTAVLTLFSTIIQAQETLEVIAVSDAYVQGTDARTDNNDVTKPDIEIWIKPLLTQERSTREGLVKFDLSTLPSKVKSATLRIGVSSGFYFKFDLFTNKTHNWNDSQGTSVTWRTAPAIGELVSNTAPFKKDDYLVVGNTIKNFVEWDITSQVLAELSDTKTISFRIIGTSTGEIAKLCSKEIPSGNLRNAAHIVYETIANLSVENSIYNNVSIYPNPSSNVITINGLQNNETNIEVFNTLGQLILKETYKESINVSKMNAGLYILKITNKDNYQTKTMRFIVE